MCIIYRVNIYISGINDRNRALNNDIVALKLKEKYSWKILEAFKSQVIQIIDEYEAEKKDESDAKLIDLFKNSLKLDAKQTNDNKNQKFNQFIHILFILELIYLHYLETKTSKLCS